MARRSQPTTGRDIGQMELRPRRSPQAGTDRQIASPADSGIWRQHQRAVESLESAPPARKPSAHPWHVSYASPRSFWIAKVVQEWATTRHGHSTSEGNHAGKTAQRHARSSGTATERRARSEYSALGRYSSQSAIRCAGRSRSGEPWLVYLPPVRTRTPEAWMFLHEPVLPDAATV